MNSHTAADHCSSGNRRTASHTRSTSAEVRFAHAEPVAGSPSVKTRLRGLIPRQKSKVEDDAAGEEKDSTPIVVVEASEVEDLPAQQPTED